MSAAFGIDFGTTNSVLAMATPNGVDAIALDPDLPGEWVNTGFEKVLPSVIGMRNQTPLFGWQAKKQLGGKLEAVKRLFATDDSVTIDGTEFRVEEAAAIFFRHIQERAAQSGVTGRLDQAVVTIPANSRGVARYRTKLSAGLAGIEVMALINEPTAAAMAHARSIGQNQRILVFDWGGGTLDVTVLQSFEGTFIEQTSKGIQRLGGLDIDKAFLDAVMPRAVDSSRWSEADLNQFRLDLELAKIKLSTQTETQVRNPTGGFVEVTRALFEEAVHPLIDRTRDPVERCLRESPGRIDHLVMVGGSSKMPIIQRFVADLVGTEVDGGVDPMTAIAEGAAIAAGILSGMLTDLDFWVATEHALGTIVHNNTSPQDGEFSVLIPRNIKLPARATDTYLPGSDFQEQVNIEVLEGDPAQPIGHEDNVVLKTWTIDLLEPRIQDDASFTVTYEYDVDGILHVLVQDVQTGSIMMDEELSFGAGGDRSQLPGMRRRVDTLMMGGPERNGASAKPVPAPSLTPESLKVLKKVKERVLPLVADSDRVLLETLIQALEKAGPQEEAAARQELERELRNHAYLL